MYLSIERFEFVVIFCVGVKTNEAWAKILSDKIGVLTTKPCHIEKVPNFRPNKIEFDRVHELISWVVTE